MVLDNKVLIPAHIFVQNLGKAVVEKSKSSTVIFAIEAAARSVNLSDCAVAAKARRQGLKRAL